MSSELLGRLKLIVANDNLVYLTRIFDGQLWYKVSYTDGYGGEPKVGQPIWTFEFPVPISEIGTATFYPQDRAILFMRYIRKHMQFLHAAQEESKIVGHDTVEI